MKAMILNQLGRIEDNPRPLDLVTVPDPLPQPGEVRLRIQACGVCHTELDEIEGRTPPPELPMIPGHQVVGRIDRLGSGVNQRQIGDRVGVAWIFSACGQCTFCRQGNENLCPQFKATGRDAAGGYAQYMCVPADFTVPLPDRFSDLAAAPLLCAGAIGYRSLRLTGLADGQTLGLMGFGASAHLVLQMVGHTHPQSRVYVFARNPEERRFALDLGAVWAGDIADRPPEPLAAVVDTTPAWKPVVAALAGLAPGGRLVINAIRKESVDQDNLLQLEYPRHLWMEKEIKSVANVARRDVSEFITLAADLQLAPEVTAFPLKEANQALYELRRGQIRGAKVLQIEEKS